MKDAFKRSYRGGWCRDRVTRGYAHGGLNVLYYNSVESLEPAGGHKPSESV